MSDYHNAYLVILEHDIRDDQALSTLSAINQIKGVLQVIPQVSDTSYAIARARIRSELFSKLTDVISAI
jgi:hypothetical protein